MHWLKNIVSLKTRAYIKDYCKRNGLLTLSVFAVVTGCVLGFVLRAFNLSTQVWMDSKLTGGNVTGFGSYRFLLSSITLIECGGTFNRVRKSTHYSGWEVTASLSCSFLPCTETVVKAILANGKVEQQGYRSCMALLKVADKYSAQRLENACHRALSFTPSPSYKNVLAILKSGSSKGLDKVHSTR